MVGDCQIGSSKVIELQFQSVAFDLAAHSAWTSRPALYLPLKIEVDLQWSFHAVLKNAQTEPLPASYTLANAPILDRGKPLARIGKLAEQLRATPSNSEALGGR
jgi:hypothetical protein